MSEESDGDGYVPTDRDMSRFIGADGLPSLRLIPYRDSSGGDVLQLCEDTTGLLVKLQDARLPAAGVLASKLRGEAYYQDSCRAGDFRPGAEVMLVPEPNNPHDDRAVAVFDRTGQHRAGYMNKQKARAYLARRESSEDDLVAISVRGQAPGVETPYVAIIAATPEVLAHLLSPRPEGAPAPKPTRWKG
jgi:HIRAN domain